MSKGHDMPDPRQGPSTAPPGATATAQSGSAVLLALIVVLLVSTLAAGLARTTSVELEVAANYGAMTGAFYAADGAAQATLDVVMAEVDRRGRFPTDAELAAVRLPGIDGVRLSLDRLERVGPEVTEPLQSGFYQGLTAVTQELGLEVSAETDDFLAGRARVGMSALVDMIPIFQFTVFYQDDLEILPGPAMTLSGRIHSNSDIYLSSGNRLRIDGAVTAAGNVYNRRKDDPRAAPGRVEVRAARGWPRMDGLDADHPDWETEALTRWNGNLRDSAHGVEPLNLTLSDAARPRTLIEPGYASDSAAQRDDKLFYRAGLRILNGRAYDDAGNPVSTTDPVTGEDALRPTVLYDHREGKHMLTLEVDVEKLGRSPAYPANQLVYVGSLEDGNGIPSWQPGCGGCWGPAEWDGYAEPGIGGTTEFGIKLTRGRELPSALTVVTENPLYLRGNYNDHAKKPAALMADAVTILSSGWGRMPGMSSGDPDADLAYSLQSLSSRRANATTIHAAVMLGNTETTVGDYAGGLENVMRFLERWQGATFRFRGSLVDLWRSRHASGEWVYGNPVYTAPMRDWDFDPALQTVVGMPPFTPMVFSVRISDWRRE